MNRRATFALLLLLLLTLFPLTATAQQSDSRVTVFYNSPCRDCVKYVQETLLPVLAEFGITDVDQRDFVNERANRAELNRLSRALGVPVSLQAHLVAFIDDRIVLEGHVPAEFIRELLRLRGENPPYERIVIYQDKMPEMGQTVTHYKIWAFRGPIKEYPIETPVTEYIEWFAANRERLSVPETESAWKAGELLPLVLGAGLLDGINPCAIAVLLFFIAFLFTLQRVRAEMLLLGSVYISMIYLAYLAIGLGIMGAIVISGTPHLLAKIGSWLLIALGLVNVKDYFWYGRGITLSVPKSWHDLSFRVIKRATLPAVAVGGFLVGLCTFPCSGGIYVAVLGLLSAKTTYWIGFSYLLLYNVMFVLPLVALLVALGNRRTVGALARWEAQNKRAIKLATGAIMIVLGAAILIWFV
jgi:cytochrome c biogenesis protein CcdA